MRGIKINTRTLYDARKRKGWTQQRAADLIGCTRLSYAKYEDGSTNPTAATLDRIAEVFSVSVDTLTKPEAFNVYAELCSIRDKLENGAIFMVDDRVLDHDGRERLNVMLDIVIEYLSIQYPDLEP